MNASEPHAPGPSRRFGLAEAPSARDVAALLVLADSEIDDDDVRSVVARIARRVLRERFPAGVRDVRTLRTESGLALDVDVADSFAASAYCGHLQENEDYAAFMTLVRADDVVVDVGANFGLYAVQAAHYAGPGGLVVAYEPAPNVLDLLERNVAANAAGAAPVIVRAAGVGATAGRHEFFVASDSAFSGFARTGRSPIAHVDVIEVIALDDEPALAARDVALMKIDVEGAEGDVILGASEVMARSPRLIVQLEYSHKNLTDSTLARLDESVDMARSLGFVLFEANRTHEIVPRERAPRLSEQYSGNLYLARGGESEERLRAAWAGVEMPQRAPSVEAMALAGELAGLQKMQESVASFDATLSEICASVFGDTGIAGRMAQIRALQAAVLKERNAAASAQAEASRLPSLQRDVAVLRGDVSRWRHAHDAVVSQLTHASEAKARLETHVRRVAEDVARVSGERDAQARGAADLRVAYDTVHARLVQVVADKEAVENEVRRAAEDVARVSGERDAQARGAADLRVAYDTVHARLVQVVADKEAVETKLRAKTATLQRLNGERDAALARARQVIAEKEAIDAELRATAATLERVTGERDAAFEWVRQVVAAREAVEAELRVTAAMLERVTGERDSALEWAQEVDADRARIAEVARTTAVDVEQTRTELFEESVGASNIEGYARRLELTLKAVRDRLGPFAFILPADAKSLGPK